MILATARQFRILKRLGVVLLCAMIGSCDSNSVKQSLRYHMAKGATYKYTAMFELKSTSKLPKSEMSSLVSGRAWISLTVDEVGKDSELICRGKLDSAMVRFESGTTKDFFGGEEFIGKNVRIVFSRTGKTLSVSPIDSMPPATRTKFFDEFNPMKLLPTILFHLPEKEVGIGDSWVLDSVAAPQIPGHKSTFRMDTEFKIEGMEKVGVYDCLKISIEGSGRMNISGKLPNGMESVVDMKIGVSGFVYFAQKEGILVSAEQSGTTKMKASTGPMQSTSDAAQNRKLDLVQ
jgi:hypothetical protein